MGKKGVVVGVASLVTLGGAGVYLYHSQSEKSRKNVAKKLEAFETLVVDSSTAR